MKVSLGIGDKHTSAPLEYDMGVDKPSRWMRWFLRVFLRIVLVLIELVSALYGTYLYYTGATSGSNIVPMMSMLAELVSALYGACLYYTGTAEPAHVKTVLLLVDSGSALYGTYLYHTSAIGGPVALAALVYVYARFGYRFVSFVTHR